MFRLVSGMQKDSCECQNGDGLESSPAWGGESRSEAGVALIPNLSER